MSSDAFNKSRINTVLAVVITSNLTLADAPDNIQLSKRSKLSKESVINVSQIITIDKHFLTEHISKLSPQLMASLSEGLSLVLDL